MSSPLTYASAEEIQEVYTRLHNTFHSGVTLPLAYRRKQLLSLARLIQENSELLYEALEVDLKKPRVESALAELSPAVDACIYAAKNLEEWAKPEYPDRAPHHSSYVMATHNVPVGVTLSIAPWNYPIIIVLVPLVGAIAAGCTAVIKPSEHAPASAKVLTELFPKYLDPNSYALINGAVKETSLLLDLKWDHIFYTGSLQVGKIVAAAAAKSVTPYTLELGGKCPVYIDEKTDINLAAKRILWGKKHTSGQICVAPDYILVPRQRQEELLEALKAVYASFYPEGSLKSPDTSTIINSAHYDRIMDLIARTKGKIVSGGTGDGSRIDITIVTDVSLDDSLMEGEIFGPVLPVIAVDSEDEAIKIIGSLPAPLDVYLFSDNADLKTKFLHSTRSGGLILNDTVQQVGAYELPFGGIGASGHGAYFGKYTYITFSHKKSYIDIPAAVEPFLEYRYPPYTQEGFDFFHSIITQKLPEL